jgi:hypothetical protein
MEFRRVLEKPAPTRGDDKKRGYPLFMHKAVYIPSFYAVSEFVLKF